MWSSLLSSHNVDGDRLICLTWRVFKYRSRTGMYNLVCANTKPIPNNFEVLLHNSVKHGYIIVVNLLCIYSQPGYNDIDLCYTSSIMSDILRYPYSSLLTVTYTARLEQHSFVTAGNSPLHDVITECDCNVIYIHIWNLQFSVSYH
jgi:hypothetical protein